jgi:hypothetical protein
LRVILKQKKRTEFKDLYFSNNIPKLDYKVRESSHDFMVELIKDLCDGSNTIEALEERLWWRPDFDIDVTIKNLKNNYIFIFNQLETISQAELPDFINFLEKNIDFKFFDIKVSEQGEQLYLFMNSRGIRLTFQEKIRAEIIAKHGLDFGNLWEDAQQYFWKSKLQNKDSELGFNEFLKWIVIINIAIKKKDFTKHEKLITRPTTEEQLESLESYFIENIEDFNQQYIGGLYNATKYFFSLNEIDSIQNDPLWLTSPDSIKMPMRTYLKFLPVIYYIYRKKAEDSINHDELRRVSAFILNCNQSRTYQKNPQLYLINFIRFIKNLCDNKSLNSIMDFDTKSSEFIGRDFSKLYFEKYNSLTSINDKTLFEDFVIKMIVNAENYNVLDFLHGDYRLILQSLPSDRTIPKCIQLMESYCDKLNWFITLDFNQQRKLLLTHGNYSFPLTGVKYDFGQDKTSWGDIFTNQTKLVVFKSFLNTNIILDNEGVNNTIKEWLTNNPLSLIVGQDRYKYYLIKYDFYRNFFAWGWGENEYTIRIHTVRKSGYNTSIDIINYAVSLTHNGDVVNGGWVYGSNDDSLIKIYKNDQLYFTMIYHPSKWETGNWVLTNDLDPSNSDYKKNNDLIQQAPNLQISNKDDIVDCGRIILKFLINNI